jgi:hypothetical protein
MVHRNGRECPAMSGEEPMEETPQVPFPAGGQRYLSRTEAAQYIRTRYGFPCSRQWLAKLAVLGGGPIFRKAGRNPIYVPADLDDWAMSRIGQPQRSTSDVPTDISTASGR